MYDSFRCPCDQCNGRLTGAWEDMEDSSYMDYVPFEYGPDPYEGICCSCGQDMTDEHVFETCPSPEGWSAFIGPRVIG